MRLKGSTGQARALRKKMSLPEVLLWRELRKWPDGLRFRRKHPAGTFVLDFYCAPIKLAIEIDGMAHDMGDQPKLDAARDEWLASQGVAVLRLPARQVLSDMEGVIRYIHVEVTQRS